MTEKKKLNVLDLFSGIGGFSLGLESVGPFRTLAFCEREPYCQAVLRKHWPDVPIFDDVRTIPTDGLGRVDIIVGGFPCQPWSQAGEQRGAADDRDLWPEMASLIEKLQPRWAICENVRGFVSQPMGLERSLSDLESLGYQAVAFIIPACAVDAPHRRDRVWIIAHANIEGEPVCTVNARARRRKLVGDTSRCRQSRQHGRQSGKKSTDRCADVADASGAGLQRSGHEPREARDAGARQPMQLDKEARGQWSLEPGMGGMVDGVSAWLDEPDCGRVARNIKNRVPRLKALGNAVVPQIVGQIGRAILSAERGE
jgi:DNA (cytosine-5)-methyltransferase 1